MLEGPALIAALQECGIDHVVWIPDSTTGTWEAALTSAPDVTLVRACREGEAVALAAGLLLGGKRPLVVLQSTGLFEAGDALRNVVHDLSLPLFLLVGVRSWKAYQQGSTTDSCPRFTEPILQAWNIPYTWLSEDRAAGDLVAACRNVQASGKAAAVLLPE